jgi:threonine efflux protein
VTDGVHNRFEIALFVFYSFSFDNERGLSFMPAGDAGMEIAIALATIAGVVFLGSASPGPNFVAVSTSALSSRTSGLWTAAGVASGSITWATLGVTGLALLVSNSQGLYDALRWAGSAYLVYLGIRMLIGIRGGSQQKPNAVLPSQTRLEAWGRGYLVNMANPKTAAFVGSFFLTTLPAAAATWVYAAAVCIAGAVSLSWYSIVALLLSQQRISEAYLRVRKWIDLALATALIALGLTLIFS